MPRVIYNDPFRQGDNILVLCDTYVPPRIAEDGKSMTDVSVCPTCRPPTHVIASHHHIVIVFFIIAKLLLLAVSMRLSMLGGLLSSCICADMHSGQPANYACQSAWNEDYMISIAADSSFAMIAPIASSRRSCTAYSCEFHTADDLSLPLILHHLQSQQPLHIIARSAIH